MIVVFFGMCELMWEVDRHCGTLERGGCTGGCWMKGNGACCHKGEFVLFDYQCDTVALLSSAIRSVKTHSLGLLISESTNLHYSGQNRKHQLEFYLYFTIHHSIFLINPDLLHLTDLCRFSKALSHISRLGDPPRWLKIFKLVSTENDTKTTRNLLYSAKIQLELCARAFTLK